ncbi:unnamed protein product [Dracunculus medinensis]|uniref:Movement protein n=1 Tax=Dracunculus medinensis TaxID=318479 RepID=A0A0N4UJ45_DRAME|nr:unnamed protein product [Dracunculus medinensis]
MKPEETLVEVRSGSDVQIDRPTRVLSVGSTGASTGADLGGSSKYSSKGSRQIRSVTSGKGLALRTESDGLLREALRPSLNSRLRTGTDSGNPTV